MFTLTISPYTLTCTTRRLPSLYEQYCRHAELVSEYNLHEPRESDESESPCFLAVSEHGRNGGWPFLVAAQTFTPDVSGFHPGVLLVPETEMLFVGAGTRLLAYSLSPPCLLWEDLADFGFLGWERHGDIVVMNAEIEIATWDIHGHKLWSQFVDPPWTYTVEGGTVWINQEGAISSFAIDTGLGD